MECIFCRIASRQVPAEILYEGERVVSILDNNPIHHGHSLVFPRGHFTDLYDLPGEYFQEVMEATQAVAKALKNALQLDGFNIFSNNGAVAGQTVFHFHLHVTPRYQGDGIRFVHGLKKYSAGEMALYGDRIRKCIPPLDHRRDNDV